MDTLLIKKLLKTYKCFKGVYPCDKLPMYNQLPLNIIINTDPSYKPGEHWVAVSINKDGKGTYFDSFGLPPLKEEIFNYLEEKSTQGWSYNKTALQNIVSQTCGHYCVLFIIFKCQGLSTRNFVSKFNGNTISNDKKINRFLKILIWLNNFNFVLFSLHFINKSIFRKNIVQLFAHASCNNSYEQVSYSSLYFRPSLYSKQNVSCKPNLCCY